MADSDGRARDAYPARAFREQDPARALELIDAVGLGSLVTSGRGGFLCTSLPFMVSGESGATVLYAHMPRINPQSSLDGPALVVFQGPHAYVRPGWYETKRADGRGVPTWNYMVAHVHGRPEVVDDARFVLEQVTALSARRERGLQEPWSPADASPDYIDRLVRALVGVRVHVERIEALSKLSQDQPRGNRLGVAAGLAAEGSQDASEISGRMGELER